MSAILAAVAAQSAGGAKVQFLDFQTDAGPGPYSFAMNFGPPSADRLLVAAVHFSGTSPPSAPNIGGIASIQVTDGGTQAIAGTNEGVTLYQARVAAGTGGAVDFTVPGAARAAVGLWAITGQAADAAVVVRVASGVKPLSVTAPVLAGDVALAAAMSRNGPFTWAGLAEDYDGNVEVIYPTGASLAIAADDPAMAVSADQAVLGPYDGLVLASWR